MKVECDITPIDMENEKTGNTQPGVSVKCGRCNHCVEIFGRGDNSVMRGLMTLKEQCPEGENNFYTEGEDGRE